MIELNTTRRAFLKSSIMGIGALSLGFTKSFPSFAQSRGYPNAHFLMQPDDLAFELEPASSGCPTAMGLLLDRLRVVDFRDPADYDENHILSAANLWYPDLTVDQNGVSGFVAPAETIEEVFFPLGVEDFIDVAIYGDTGSIWAARLFWILDYYGQTNMKVLNGGFARWDQEERFRSTETPRIRESNFHAVPNPNKVVDSAWVLENLDNPDVIFVDARSASSYEAGHLPGAISKSWRENIDWDNNESFLSYEALLARFEEKGVSSEKTVISYCQTGVLSAQNFFAMRLLGYPDVRLYDGSWADWSSDPDRPVATGN